MNFNYNLPPCPLPAREGVTFPSPFRGGARGGVYE